MNENDIARFWAKVPERPGEPWKCWEWAASLTGSNGYGGFWLRGRNEKAHRVSVEIHTGNAPSDLVMHSCDNPLCVRPDHLREGTQSENMRDKREKMRGRAQPRKLSDDQVKFVHANPGISGRALARMLSVDPGSIKHIRHGRSYRDLAPASLIAATL